MSEKIGEIFVEVQAKLDKLDKDFKKLRQNSDKRATEAGNAFGTKFSDSFKSKIKGIGVALGGIFAVGKLISIGKTALKTASDFEQIRARLVSLYGDATKAKDVFSEFKKVAETTPFSLKDVASAGITLKAFGLEAEKNIKVVSDLAAFMGVSVPEAASAMGRAFAGGVGAADVFRERGILTLIKDFKGIDDITKLTLPEFRQAMIETFQNTASGIAGSTDKLAATFSGAMSNMGDAWDKFANFIMGGSLPVLGGLARGISNILNAIVPMETELDKANKLAEEQRFNFEVLSRTYERLKGKINLTETETKLYKQTMAELNSQYGDYLGNINLEADSYNDVMIAIDGARGSLLEYAKTQAIIATQKDVFNTIVEANKKILELNRQLSIEQQKLADTANYRNEQGNILFATELKHRQASLAIKETKQAIIEQETISLELQGQLNELMDQYGNLLIQASSDDTGTGKIKNDLQEITAYQLLSVDQENTKSQILSRQFLIDSQREAVTKKLVANAEREAKTLFKMPAPAKKVEESFTNIGDSINNEFAMGLVNSIGHANELKNIFADIAVSVAKMVAVMGIKKMLTGWNPLGIFAQHGLDMVVPPGFSNDTFGPIFASSGEKVQITPQGQTNNVTNDYSNKSTSSHSYNISLQADSPTELMQQINDMVENSHHRLVASETL